MESGDIDQSGRNELYKSLTGLTPRETELSSLPKTSEGILNGGQNETLFVNLKDDGSGVFKPVTGEKKWMNCEAGTLYRRERAGYLVDRFMNLDLVPSTVLRNLDGKEGSFQEYIPDADIFQSVFLKEDVIPEGMDDQLYRLWIFDQIVWNIDRHAANLLVTDGKNGKLHAIDHGYTFGYGNLRTIRDYEEKYAPRGIPELLKQFRDDSLRQEILFEQLDEMLPQEEVEACQARISALTHEILSTGKVAETVEYGPGLYV